MKDVKGMGNGRALKRGIWEKIGLALLILYPLRHVNWGLDLWDTGYNYANFQYFGMEHMDPMWLFSTFLANAAGNLLTKLPGGTTLVGLNLYTGLLASALALMGYFFCTRKLKMPAGLAFAGELAALSLCWCPTALLYNYLTYVLFLGSCILLYAGLTGGKRAYFVWAGVLLGTNVLVRFSNLPEAAMILAVWVYDFLLWRKERAAGESRKEGGAAKFWPGALRHTLWCLVGYLAALAVLLACIHGLYGLEEYAGGIRRLFAMTENASDYKPTAMIMGVLGTYVQNLYWVVRMGAIVVGGMVLFALADWLERKCAGGRIKGMPSWAALVPHWGVRVVWILTSGAMLAWLYYRSFCSVRFYSYDSILRPGILFLMLTMFIALVRIFLGELEEKLAGGMLILIILLTSLGSNNDVYPSLNNLFWAAPYTLWQSWRFLRKAGDGRIGIKLRRGRKAAGMGGDGALVSSLPAKGILTAFLAMCMFQFAGFGAKFVFAEATGVRDANAYVENNAVLKNVRMSAQKAQWMEELGAYAGEKELQGRQVILYGDIPALSFYLQMPSAFNPWSDLDSYGYQVMEEDLRELAGRIQEKGAEKPVVIAERRYALYEEGGSASLESAGMTEMDIKAVEQDGKWILLREFMEDFGYEETFRNEKFAVFEPAY